MLSLKKVLLLATSATSIFSPPLQSKLQSSSLDTWLSAEAPIAQQGVLDNIGANGAKAPGAKAGVVVASPSMTDPPCQCSCTLYCSLR